MNVNTDNLNFSEACDVLRTWRENGDRNSDDVVEIWNNLLQNNVNKLGNEKFTIIEQVLVAALDCHELPIADKLIKLLSTQFPNSSRVLKYKVMQLEVRDNLEDAFDWISGADHTNSGARKRAIVIWKSVGRYPVAIKELCEYLKKYQADQEAWHELSNLYLIEQEYAKAAFCFEEVLLHNPHNHLVHQRMAEIKYTQGGYDNIEIARSYYMYTLKLNPDNLRALYGLFLCNYNIVNSQKCPALKKKDASKALGVILKRLQSIYDTDKVAMEALQSIL